MRWLVCGVLLGLGVLAAVAQAEGCPATLVCDDGDPCTTDSSDIVLGCVNVPDLFCQLNQVPSILDVSLELLREVPAADFGGARRVRRLRGLVRRALRPLLAVRRQYGPIVLRYAPPARYTRWDRLLSRARHRLVAVDCAVMTGLNEHRIEPDAGHRLLEILAPIHELFRAFGPLQPQPIPTDPCGRGTTGVSRPVSSVGVDDVRLTTAIAP